MEVEFGVIFEYFAGYRGAWQIREVRVHEVTGMKGARRSKVPKFRGYGMSHPAFGARF